MDDDRNRPSGLDSDLEDVGGWPFSLLNLYLDWEQFSLHPSQETETPGPFVSRCLDSAAIAQALCRYCACAEAIGFAPISFGKYVERLESMSELSADPVLTHFGIRGRRALDDVSLQGFARMWRALRKTLREAIINLRITLMLPDSAIAGVRFRGSGVADSIASCENVLKEASRSLTSSQRARLLEIEKRFLEVFEETGGETSK